MTPMSAFLDSGAGPNVIRKRSVPESWQHRIKTGRDLVLTAAPKQIVEVKGVIFLHLRVGDQCVRVLLGVVPSIVVRGQLQYDTVYK